MGYYLGAAADTGCYRFKSERRRIRDKKQHRDKQLLKLDRKLEALCEQRRNLPMVELSPPVQRGWVRYFVLRDDVARSKDAVFYEGILTKINTKVYCSRKDFMKKKRRGSRHRNVPEQYLLSPAKHRFCKLQFSEKEKLLFEKQKRLSDDLCYRETYVFLEPWRFALVIRPNLVTKIKRVDPILEASVQEIRNKLNKQNLRGRLYKAKGKRRNPWKGYELKHKEIYEYQNTPLHAILGMIEADACTEQTNVT